jgi:hypothetical protein
VQPDKRQLEVRHGVDKVSHQVTASGREFVDIVAEGDYLDTRIEVAQPRDSVGLQAGAINQEATVELTVCSRHYQSTHLPAAGVDLSPHSNRTSRLLQEASQHLGHSAVVHDARFRHEESGDAGHMRLPLSDLVPAQPAALQSETPAPLLQRAESRQVAFPGRNHYAAAALVGDAVLVTKAVQRLAAGDTVVGLEGSWTVEDAGMDNARVVTALVGGKACLRFQDDDAEVVALGERPGRGRAYDSPADDGYVRPGRSHDHLLGAMRARMDATFLSDQGHRIRFVYTPKHTSWLNQVEMWFSILVRKLLRHSSFTSVEDLKARILAFIDYFNRTMAKPIRWLYSREPKPVNDSG